MYLKSLTLKGFKSFAKKTTLDFEDGISCVVGPNGSGKSNISDAILWVLGERSAKNIRGEAMQDVIFAGTKDKSRSAMAEVSLCLDNADGTLNIDFSQIEITRRMYRSGESDYWLNDTPVRRLDVLNILHDSGLGEGTHSIISQGSLDSVLSFDSFQLRSIIEEVAGILKHKQKKIKSISKLEAMRANVDRISDVVEEIQRQLRPLRSRAKRAETYLEIKDDLKEANLKIAVDDFKKASVQKNELEQNVEVQDAKINEIEQSVSTINSQISDLTKKIKEQNDKRGIEDKKTKKYRELLSKLDSVLLLLGQTFEALTSQSTRESIDAQRISVELAALQKTYGEEEENLSGAKQERSALKERIDNLGENLKEIQQRQKASQIEVDKILEERSSRDNKIQEITEEINSRIAEEQGKKAKLEFLQEKKQNLIQSIQDAQNVLEAKRKSIETTDELLSDLKMRDKEAKELTKSCLIARNSAEDALSKARIDLDACSAQILALENIAKTQDVSKNVSQFVQSSKKLSSDDYLLKQISVDEGYENVVERMLLQYRDSLVVEGTNDAIEVKCEMKDAKTSLILLCSNNKLKKDSLHGFDCLLDHIKAKGEAKTVITNLLGKVYVCNTLEDCISNHEKHPEYDFVTLQGESVSCVGAVSINNREDQHNDVGVLLRARQIEELKQVLNENKNNVSRLTKEVDDALSSLKDAQETSLKITQQLTEIQAKFDSLKTDANSKNDEFVRLKDSLTQVENEIANIDVSNTGSETSVDELRKLLESQTTLKATSEALLKDKQEVLSKITEELESKKEDINNLNPKLAVLDERCTQLISLCESRKARMKTLEKRISEIEEKKTRITTEITEVSNYTTIFQNLSNEFADKNILFDSHNPEAEDQVSKMFDDLSNLRQQSQEKQKQKDEVYQTISNLKIELTKTSVNLQSASDRISSNFDGDIKEALDVPELENRDEVLSTAQTLGRKIEKLGSIDLSARADYEALLERFEFLNSNLDDIKNSIVAIEKIDTYIEKRFREQFQTTFDEVNNNFQKTFKDLFPGGNGQLGLTNPDNIDETGVDISANPAGKKIRKISLLSGGEKSLVALSFLFALYTTRKTPFYVLDEVEAALDDTNLTRMLAYIDSMRQHTQFIFITHQRRTMEMADVLFGVSMGDDGITKVISQRLNPELMDDGIN